MSSDAAILDAYREDQKHPFYSVQHGRPFRKKAEHASRPSRPGMQPGGPSDRGPAKQYFSDGRWVWGHFRNALIHALKG